jgi:calcium-dependent protein kinase
VYDGMLHPERVPAEQAKDCVRCMLDRDPQERASAAQCLKHEWLRENGCANDTPIEAEVFKRIKKFSGTNALKREALLLISANLPLDEVSGLREMFLEIDEDRSGSITVEEFTAALQRKGQTINQAAAQQIMQMADINGDGELDYEEFLSSMLCTCQWVRRLVACRLVSSLAGSGSRLPFAHCL